MYIWRVKDGEKRLYTAAVGKRFRHVAASSREVPWTDHTRISAFIRIRRTMCLFATFRLMWFRLCYSKIVPICQMFHLYSGLAYTSSICSYYSLSIVEDQLRFMTFSIAAHELGHRYVSRTNKIQLDELVDVVGLCHRRIKKYHHVTEMDQSRLTSSHDPH